MTAEAIRSTTWQPPETGTVRPLGWAAVSFILGCVACWWLTAETQIATTRMVGNPSEQTGARLAPAADTSSSSGGAPAAKVQEVADLAGDWPQWGGTPHRNNVPDGKNIPESWEVGEFDRLTGAWNSADAQNIKWVSRLGSQTYGNPVVANGRVYVGTNNGAGYLARYPDTIDLGCLLCFDVKDGGFLWQHSSEKLPTGRVHDWPLQGICCAPLVEGDRLWFVTSRGEVVCADAAGFHDGEDDGPVRDRWVALFREAPLATSGLEQNLVPVPIAALLKRAGVALTGRVRVDEVSPETWKLTIRGAATSPVQVLRVHVQGPDVEIHRLAETADGVAPPTDAPLIKAPNDLLTGVDQGKLNESLTALLVARGLPIEQITRVTPKVAGMSWVVEVTSSAGKRSVELRKEG
ncbi:MAG TPA: PQQ-binding-like beta-propeller repeat protein, partial [Pirellulaceae bacterium]